MPWDVRLRVELRSSRRKVGWWSTLVFSPASPLTNAPFLMKTMPYRNDQLEPVHQVFDSVFTIAVRRDVGRQSLVGLDQLIFVQASFFVSVRAAAMAGS